MPGTPSPVPTPAGTLDVSLTVSPTSGAAPLRTTLTARVGGTATGTINYTFYCHRTDPGTNITQPWDRKFDGVNATQWVVPDGCTYSSPGTYAAKVIAERGPRAAEARVTITVTSPTTPTPLPQVSASITPTSGPPGTIFTVTWSGFSPSSPLTSHLRRPDGSTFPPMQFTTDAAGRAAGTINSTGFASGRYTHWAIDDRTGRRTSDAFFEVTAAPAPPPVTPAPVTPVPRLEVSIAPASGLPGTVFTVTWSGFSPNSTITSYLRRPDGAMFPTMQFHTDASGRATATINSAGFAPGRYAHWAVDDRTGRRTSEATFEVTAAPVPVTPLPRLEVSIAPPSGPPGTVFTVAWSGFSPSSTLTSHLRRPDGSAFPPMQFQTDAGGRGTATMNSVGFAPGRYVHWAVDDRTGRQTAQVTFEVTAISQAGVTVEQLGRILLGTNYSGPTNGFHLPGHAGIDYRAQTPLPFCSPVSGTVAVADVANGHLAITGANNYVYIFLHLSQIAKTGGQTVVPGEVLGRTGSTLYRGVPITGPHLHIEVRTGGRTSPADPNVESSYRYNVNPTSVINTPQVTCDVTAAPATPIPAPATPAPVPAPVQVSITPSSGPAGTIFTVTWTGFTPNATLTSHLRRPDGSTVPPVQFATDASGRATATINSAGFASGRYTHWAVDDRTGRRTPDVTFEVTAAATLPDLTIAAAVAGSYLAGQTVQIPVTVYRSGGPLTTGPFVHAKLYWSTTPTWSPANPVLWSSNDSLPDFPTSVLNSAGSRSVVATITIPSVPAGTYYLIAYADAPTSGYPSGFYAESNEVNNTAAYAVTVTPAAPPPTATPTAPPVSAIISPPSGPAGTIFTVTWTGFTPNATLTSHLRRPDGSTVPPVQFATDASGRATATINSAGFASGRYTHWAVDDRTGRQTPQVSFDVITAPVTPTPTAPPVTLTVALTANPSSGPAPLNNVTLTATTGGTATGTINYTFYCNRADPGTNITPGWVWKSDGVTVTSWTAVNICNYASPGTYTAKVIVERGALATQAQQSITVTAAHATPTPTPGFQVGGGAPSPAVFVDAYNRNGGAAALGTPTGPARRWGAGWVQDLRGGSRAEAMIAQADGAGAAYVVGGTILQRYRSTGGPTHFIGFPTADEGGPGPPSSRTGRTNRYQAFQRGSLQWILQTNQVFIVQGDIFRLWASLGYQASCLGLPVSDEYPSGGGSRSDFEGGYVTWTQADGSRHFCR